MADIQITHDADMQRYQAFLGSELAGCCEYKLQSGAIMFTHTEVLEAHEGKGVGSRLAEHVLDAARSEGQQVIPACQFIADYIRKHPAYAELVPPDAQRDFKL